MGQIARHRVAGVIITITRTAQTYLVTIEDASTGFINNQFTEKWATENEARAMARNAYRWFAYRASLDLAA
jgi:hypothetical protein